MTEPTEAENVCHLFVDEAGDTDIFDGKGRILLDQGKCSRFFMMGMLEVADPLSLAEALTSLRLDLLSDPEYSKAPSFDPKRKKTALKFHAKDDLSAVRMRVFEVLRSFERGLRFRAVVSNKYEILKEIRRKEQADPNYHFRQTDLYDHLTELLFSKFTRLGVQFHLRIASRGNRERSEAIMRSVENKERNFHNNFGFSRGGKDVWDVKVTEMMNDVCLQAVDYYLWALQRMYETRTRNEAGEFVREAKYLDGLWDQISQIYDMHFRDGTYFIPTRPLTLQSRFGGKIQ